jgi:hypothetical protein
MLVNEVTAQELLRRFAEKIWPIELLRFLTALDSAGVLLVS